MVLASSSPTPLTAERSPWLRGPIRLPGDPALAASAMILAAMARGESILDNIPAGPMIDALAIVLRELGAHVVLRGGRWHVQGIGIGGFLTPRQPLDLRDAGPAAPLLVGLLGGHDMESELLCPSGPVIDALLDFLRRGGGVAERAGDRIRLRGPRFGIPLDLALSSEAQLLVAPLLLNALVTTGRSMLHLDTGLRDPIEALLGLFGAKLMARDAPEGQMLVLDGMTPLRAQTYAVPGDPALAAIPAVAAMVAPDSEITISGVALQPGALACLDALALLGGDIAIGESHGGGADIVVRHGALAGTAIPFDLGIEAEDYPLIAVAAAFAPGETMLEGLGEGVRRLALTRALRASGVECVEQPGGLLIRGQARVPGGEMSAGGLTLNSPWRSSCSAWPPTGLSASTTEQ